MVDVFLIHDDADLVAPIRNLITSNPEYSLVHESGKGREGVYALASIPPGRPRICVLRLSLPDVHGLELIPQIKVKHPDVYVVPILEGNETGQIWQRLMQLELQDCINGNVSPDEMSIVLNTASGKAQRLFEQNKTARGELTDSFVITFLSARGGLGKTVLASNMATALAKLSKQVLLADFSLNPGDFPVMLDDVPRNTIMDAVNAGGGLDAEMIQNLLATHKLGFRYLACPNEEFDPKAFDYNIASSLVQVMRSVAAYTIIDTGIAYSEPTIAAADQSDIVFLVTNRDVTRLLAAQRLLRYLKEREIPISKIKVIVNQAEIGIEISESEIESTLEHPVTAYIPSNPGAVTYSINKGEPLVASEPTDALSHIISRLSQLCYNHWQDKPMPEKPEAARGGLFKKKTGIL